MPLASGTHPGLYEILAPVGTGGMGKVDRARDARLGRDVAVKMLPVDVASNAERPPAATDKFRLAEFTTE